MDLKQMYEKFKKKYGLPSYDELNFEFELLYVPNIKDINFPLRFVRRRMCDKIGWYIGYLQSILQPNPNSIINIQESNFLSDEKDKIFKLIRELIQITSISILNELEHDEKSNAEFIKNNFKKWLKIKKDIIKLIKKIVKKWKEEIKEDKTKERYFG